MSQSRRSAPCKLIDQIIDVPDDLISAARICPPRDRSISQTPLLNTAVEILHRNETLDGAVLAHEHHMGRLTGTVHRNSLRKHMSAAQ